MSDAYTIGEGEVHVWLTDCDTIDDEPMRGLLDADEANRAKRFREPVDSRRYIVSHGVLRSILSKYMDMKPEIIKYERSLYGKPGLAGGSWLHFNMSHSNGMAAYAITSNREVGIDLEYLRDIPFTEISHNVLSKNEDDYLRSVPAEERLNIFFTLWTRKESYIKAIGEGLHAKLNDIDVFFQNEMYSLSYCGSNWSIIDITTPDGYKAALTVQDDRQRIKTVRLQHYRYNAYQYQIK